MKEDIKSVDADTIAAQQEREALRIDKEQRHSEYESRLEQLQQEHEMLVKKLANETKVKLWTRLTVRYLTWSDLFASLDSNLKPN